MIGVAAYFYYLTVELVADAAQVAVEFGFDQWVYEWLAMLGAENDVKIVFYERLSHSPIVYNLPSQERNRLARVYRAIGWCISD